ncbi:Putative dihydrolipoamide s-acetyltransferase component of pyruvate dehydrogenase complex E2 [Mycobacterium tuberculosis]|nr:Putative dihydrolipoamide s-acetyltransferase component of pyruvate dehydrogenase complex E2 [Mycobacterium tuberculosis]
MGSGWTEVPHTRLRRAIASRLTESKRTAPHFYVEGTARADELLALRARLNESTGERISVNDLIIKAVARAHVAVPRMNVIWTDDAVREFDEVDVAVAIATPQGLVTPVVRRADSLGLGALAATTRDYAARARDGRLRPVELDGGSVTVSNLGMYGTRAFSAIINPPQASILAVGAAIESPVVVDGELAVARTMALTLSVDHRPVDGAVAADWMREFIGLLEEPLRLVV